ncbi:HNH endonuclease domain protein [Bordetella hinzii L60]|nr:HNH endonuclease domain protein [Bordetella hinzii L60]
MSTILEEKGIRTLGSKKARPSGRNADPRRAIPLNSSAWRKLRAYILAESPLCEHCAERGLVVQATDVDHVNGDPSDNSMANLASLCHSCHSIKTARDHGKSVYMGCDVNGMPLDPDHPWNVEGRQRNSLEADG